MRVFCNHLAPRYAAPAPLSFSQLRAFGCHGAPRPRALDPTFRHVLCPLFLLFFFFLGFAVFPMPPFRFPGRSWTLTTWVCVCFLPRVSPSFPPNGYHNSPPFFFFCPLFRAFPPLAKGLVRGKLPLLKFFFEFGKWSLPWLLVRPSKFTFFTCLREFVDVHPGVGYLLNWPSTVFPPKWFFCSFREEFLLISFFFFFVQTSVLGCFLGSRLPVRAFPLPPLFFSPSPVPTVAVLFFFG